MLNIKNLLTNFWKERYEIIKVDGKLYYKRNNYFHLLPYELIEMICQDCCSCGYWKEECILNHNPTYNILRCTGGQYIPMMMNLRLMI